MIDTKTNIRMHALASDTAILVLVLYDPQKDRFLLLPHEDEDPAVDNQIRRAVDKEGAVPVGILGFTPLEGGQFVIDDERYPGLEERCPGKADAIVNRAKELFTENLLQAGIIKPIGTDN
jgi:hypothetical protein